MIDTELESHINEFLPGVKIEQRWGEPNVYCLTLPAPTNLNYWHTLVELAEEAIGAESGSGTLIRRDYDDGTYLEITVERQK